MREDVYLQFYAFLQTFYGGIIIGLVYDTMSRVIYAVTKRVGISDSLFWLVGGIFIIKLFFDASYFALRFYLVLGFLLGWGLYYFFISRIYKRILGFFIGLMTKAKRKTASAVVKEGRRIKHKYREPMSQLKIKVKRVCRLPFSEKMRYNKFRNYFRREKQKDG